MACPDRQADQSLRKTGICRRRSAAGQHAPVGLVDAFAGDRNVQAAFSRYSLIDPDGHFHALFSPPLKAADIVSDFIRIAEAY